jgi:hypothetical protein
LDFGFWILDFGFVWDLEFGVWDFICMLNYQQWSYNFILFLSLQKEEPQGKLNLSVGFFILKINRKMNNEK